MSDDESMDELIAHAELGDEAKQFLAGNLGKCLIGMAQQEVHAADEALRKVLASDTEAIRELQYQAKFGLAFEQWLNELLFKGEAALNVIVQRRSE